MTNERYAGRAWQSEPFRLQVANASGKHNGSDAPGMFATYFNCDLVVDTATRALFQIAFDDRRVPFTAELLSAALASPINVVLSPAVQIPPGTYRLQAGGRAGDSEGSLCRSRPPPCADDAGGVAPGAFSVRVISEAGIKLAVSAKASSVTKTFADTFQRAYLDRRVFRENISTTSKEPVSVYVIALLSECCHRTEPRRPDPLTSLLRLPTPPSPSALTISYLVLASAASSSPQ